MLPINVRSGFFLSLFSSLLLSFSSPALAVSSGGGRTIQLSGQYQTQGGQATYVLPVDVAPGRAGFQPELSLSYQSDGSNGLLGMGWQLDGISVISRCGQNRITDGHWRGVNFNSDDRYCLDGQRLIAITGRDGGNRTEYRVEKNGYKKVVSYGSLSGGPEYFKVWSKDGSVREYGATGDSRAVLSGQGLVYQWRISKQTDLSGENHIHYQYETKEQSDVPLLSEISYTGGKLSFTYEERTDKRAFYLYGGKLTKNYRLSSITTYDSALAAIGDYKLTYDYASGTKRSLLQKVQFCATGGLCSTPVRFEWQSQDRVELSTREGTSFKTPQLYDANGDGQATFYGVLDQNETTGKMKVMDLQGKTHQSVMSYALSGNSFNPTLKFNQCKYNVGASYLNENGEYKPYCQFSTCSGDSCQYASKGVNAGDFDGDGTTETVAGYLVADFNGDGRDDKHRFDIPGGGYKYLISGGETGTLPSAGTQVLKVLGDINQDGYLDVVMGPSTGSDYLSVYLFDGKRFLSPVKLSNKVKHDDIIVLGDMNGDGYPELGVGGKFYLNRFGELSDQVLFDTHQQLYALNDINGDGWLDILSRTAKTAKVDKQLSVPQVQDKITAIGEFGVRYQITYLPASDPEVNTFVASDAFPVQSMTPARYLVSAVEKKPEGYDPISYHYLYQGAKVHLTGGGFLGFEKITETETATVTTKTETTYEQTNLHNVGSPLTVRIYKNDYLVSSVTYQYQDISHTGLTADYFQVFASDIVKKQYQPQDDGAVIKQETITQQMDTFGNITKEVHQYSSDVSGAGSYTRTTVSDYVSPGSNQNNAVYQSEIQTQSSETTSLPDYPAGMGRYCTESGEVYFKPNDLVVLIGVQVITPVIAKQYDQYFKYVFSEMTNAGNGVSTHTGKLVSVSQSEFEHAQTYACGDVNVSEDTAAGVTKLVSVKTVSAELITETPGRFWRLSAPSHQTTTITDNSSGLSHTTRTGFTYTDKGLLTNRTVSGSDYGSQLMSGDTLTEQYQYDSWGNVSAHTVSGTGVSARTTRYQYGSNGLYLSSASNAAGHTTTSTYNSRGLLTRTVSALKSRTSGYHYDDFGRVVTETLPGKNNQVTYAYSLGTDCPYSTDQTVSCSVTKATSRGSAITLYDYAGREIRKLHQAFNGQWVSVSTGWDTSGRKIMVSRPAFVSQKSKAAYVTFRYDILDRETEKSEPSATGNRAVYRSSYSGLTTTSTDAKGNKHYITYDVMGYVQRKDEPLSAYQTYQYYPDGKLRSSTDSAGNTTRITYDGLGYRRTLDDPDMGKWQYVYNALGELTYKRDANGIVTRISYDTLGRKVKQVEDGHISVWQYDGNGAPGTLTRFAGYGNTTQYSYNSSGLADKVSVTAENERFSTRYVYDGLERVTREIRPNGSNKDQASSSSSDTLAVEYVYNPHGYLSAVRSPRSSADEEFTSEKFRTEIRQLLDQVLAKANEYLTKAERYHSQYQLYSQQAKAFREKTTNKHQLDSASVALLGKEHKFQQWCSDDGECYLLPVGWSLIGVNVSVPVEAVIGDDVYRMDTIYSGTDSAGNRLFSASLQRVSVSEFKSLTLTRQHDFVVSRSGGTVSLISDEDVYVAEVSSSTRQELLYTAEDLDEAATLAKTKQKFFTTLAEKLITLSEKVAALSGLYCQDAQKLGGQHSSLAGKWGTCAKPTGYGQADTLQLILDQSELEASKDSQAYIYYWQRTDTDAYDHTLSEILGNGLVNEYQHNAATGQPGIIRTLNSGKSIRALYYRYDEHNNVTYRYDEELGITDRWTYDAQDRVISNRIALVTQNQHGTDNPDFAQPFEYRYDKLGNLTFKTNIGDLTYNNKKAGPHAVIKANGLTYQYDSVGNMLRAYKTGTSSDERTLTWTPFNKPSVIHRNGNEVEFRYDANHNRYLKKSSDGTETFYFGKTYERIVNAKTGETQHKHFVYADGKLIALNTQIRDKENKLKNKQVRYLHYDALNSVDMITDGYGNVVERRSYDTWGKQRKVLWRSSSASELIQEVITNRGYTGHEEIKEVGLIHMNGRVYDQELGRFLSADPHIQAPFLVNSFNRYSYVMNNPLKYVDPTGFSWVGGETCNVSTGEGCKTSKSPSSPDNGGNNDDNHQGKKAEESKTTSDVSAKESVVGSDTNADSGGDEQKENDLVGSTVSDDSGFGYGISQSVWDFTKDVLNVVVESAIPSGEEMAVYTGLGEIALVTPGPFDDVALGVGILGHRVVKVVDSLYHFSINRSKFVINKGIWTSSRVGAVKTDHIFSKKHIKNGIMDLGASPDDILSKGRDILTRFDQSGQLKEGSNMINTRMNGYDATVRGTFKDGRLQSMNIMKGHSAPKKGWNVVNDF
ncbi:RHS repeat-associated core domain-containing protein [Vibrio salinus]|uniref:RHS repeat-associated core domain-containing protein n=1 Tax=Vibrio salinus TaxID=2899784 RepID=UPI001E313327|nr:RHS repeat-associated core domain-containing protein [Vibrio salinus]MCE0494154.1 FG-GAP-like repeat-containing protein [Vibrio salinus]